MKVGQALLTFLLLKVTISPTGKIRVKPIHWIKFRGEKDRPTSEEKGIAKAGNPVGPDKPRWLLFYKKVTRCSEKPNTCCMNRIFINSISSVIIMLHFTELDRFFTIDMFMEENLNLLPGIYLCP